MSCGHHPQEPVLCSLCFATGRLTLATGYLAGNSVCDTHREELEDAQAAAWDAIADHLGDA